MSQGKPSAKATVSDVARAAGVSTATVSRAINGSPLVTEATRQAVQEAIGRTGFVLNARGRALRTGRSESVAVLVTEPLDELFDDPTYGRLLRGVAESLSENHLLPVIIQASSPAEQDLALRSFRRRTVDAIIHLTPYKDRDLLSDLAELGLPVVLCGQLDDPAVTSAFSVVHADDVVGARLAAQYVVDAGRHAVAAVLGPRDNPATVDRLRGYRQVLYDQLLDDRIMFTGWDADSGLAATRDLLTRQPNLDAILCGSDRIAVGALAALATAGRTVPGDVAVVGFDDHSFASTTTPPLTTIAQPLRQEGQQAAHLAIDMISGAPASTQIMAMTLVIRESA